VAAAERRVERPERRSARTILKIMNSKRGFTLIELLAVNCEAQRLLPAASC